MRKITWYCDRCKKQLEGIGVELKHKSVREHVFTYPNMQITEMHKGKIRNIHICNSCADSFSMWIDSDSFKRNDNAWDLTEDPLIMDTAICLLAKKVNILKMDCELPEEKIEDTIKSYMDSARSVLLREGKI